VFAYRSQFLFPQRCACLKVIHDEFARRKGITAMGPGNRHQDDLIRGMQRTDPVDHQGIVNVPAPRRLFHDGGERLFRHARIVIQRHL